MENVAAITYRESYIQRGKKTRTKHRRTAGVILHEIAHQWFGDLVTMKWWNDLWLNESFPTYMAQLALVRATEFKEAWFEFSDVKFNSLWQDNLVTTWQLVVDGELNLKTMAEMATEALVHENDENVQENLVH